MKCFWLYCQIWLVRAKLWFSFLVENELFKHFKSSVLHYSYEILLPFMVLILFHWHVFSHLPKVDVYYLRDVIVLLLILSVCI